MIAPSASPFDALDSGRWIAYEWGIPEVNKDNAVGNRLIRPDGTGDRWATPDAPIGGGKQPGEGWQLHPDWSPDGQRLAFEVDVVAGGYRDIWLSDADGRNEHLLYHCDASCNTAEFPAWSPDGRSLIFVVWKNNHGQTDGSQLLRLDVATGRVTTVATTRGAAYLTYPRFSPDGRRVVTELDTWTDMSDSSTQSGAAVAIVDLTTTPATVKPITSVADGWATYPDWHPSQDLILYSTSRWSADDPGAADLYTIRPDGSGRTLLLHDPWYRLAQPRWLPDGSGVIFLRVGGSGFGDPFMATAASDGSNVTWIGGTPHYGSHPLMRRLPGDGGPRPSPGQSP